MEVRALMVRRIFSVIVDLSISVVLFFYLFSFKFFLELISDLSVIFNNAVSARGFAIPHTEYAVTVALIYFIYVNLRFIGTLCFGVSLGQLIIGIYANGNPIWKRIGGGTRVILEFFLSPLIVFDLPIVFKQRTIKEVLTLTSLVTKRSVTNLLAGFMLTILFVVLAFISPLFANLAVFDHMDFNIVKSKTEKLSDKSEFDQYRGYYSNYFHFSFFSSLDKGRYTLIPSYEVMKVDGEMASIPYMSIYDSKYDAKITFTPVKDVDLHQVLERGRSFNPLFYARYPNLAKIIAKKATSRKAYHPEFGGRTIMSREVKAEVIELITYSFELSLSNILDHIASNGPFISGNLQLRNSILALASQGTSPTITLKKYGDQTFLSLMTARDQKISKSLISLSSLTPVLLRIDIVGSQKPNESLEDFEKFFLSSSSWFFDYHDIFQVPLNKDDFEPFSFVDFWDDENILGEKRKVIEDSLYHHLFDVGKKALSSGNDNFYTLVEQSLNRLFMVSKERWEKKLVSDDFASYIKTLTIAFKNKDKNYFGLN